MKGEKTSANTVVEKNLMRFTFRLLNMMYFCPTAENRTDFTY